MRTTITLSDDVAAEVERLRRERGVGPSEVVNALARRGMAAADTPAPRYEHHSTKLGLKVDVRNIGEVLDLLDEESPYVNRAATWLTRPRGARACRTPLADHRLFSPDLHPPADRSEPTLGRCGAEVRGPLARCSAGVGAASHGTDGGCVCAAVGGSPRHRKPGPGCTVGCSGPRVRRRRGLVHSTRPIPQASDALAGPHLAACGMSG
ncbi:CopG family transcriptional regulator [Serinicoccus profundi]|uniref:ribbon-helix-helix domain-containing protein n=1 Tax=Serinicoccus profundi TaxID=1078471 RepID=UPI00114790E2|nr:CopG family transcriptional regulator [Serinicoccus profundi]